MKLVIDIPEEDYKSACKREFSMDGSMMIYNAIKEGTEYKEQPHGEWIPVIGCDGRTIAYKCKTCGWFKPHDIMPFCENCGANMRKGGE